MQYTPYRIQEGRTYTSRCNAYAWQVNYTLANSLPAAEGQLLYTSGNLPAELQTYDNT
jgi:hypothetical protein